MKTWGWFLWAYFFLWVITIAAIFYSAFKNYSSVGCLKEYIVWIAAILLFTVWNTKRLAPEGYSVHIHHYVIACVMITVLCYQSNFLTFCHGWFNGMAIEGGCRWGFDAIWQKKDDPSDTVEIFERWFHSETHKHTLLQRMKWVLMKDLHSKKRVENL